MPALRRLPPGETSHLTAHTDTYHCIDEYDVPNQGQVSHHFRAVDGGFEHRTIPFHYVWPSELDLMARLAGMTLRERWGSWTREPFTADSTQHISVWKKPAAP